MLIDIYAIGASERKSTYEVLVISAHIITTFVYY